LRKVFSDGFPPPQPTNAHEFLFHTTHGSDRRAGRQPDRPFHRLESSGNGLVPLQCRGDAVEMLAPEPLREMVEQHRRDDFPALP